MEALTVTSRTITMAAACALALLLCSAVLGQRKDERSYTNLREVRGIVTDSSGVPVEKAAVLLKDTKSLQIKSDLTDTAGRYHFAGLRADVEYQLKAEQDGAVSNWKTLSPFNTNNVAVLNLKLKR
jgi:hypothetical protein